MKNPDLVGHSLSLMQLSEADTSAALGLTWGPWVDFLNDLWTSIGAGGGTQPFTSDQRYNFYL